MAKKYFENDQKKSMFFDTTNTKKVEKYFDATNTKKVKKIFRRH